MFSSDLDAVLGLLLVVLGEVVEVAAKHLTLDVLRGGGLGVGHRGDGGVVGGAGGTLGGGSGDTLGLVEELTAGLDVVSGNDGGIDDGLELEGESVEGGTGLHLLGLLLGSLHVGLEVTDEDGHGVLLLLSVDQGVVADGHLTEAAQKTVLLHPDQGEFGGGGHASKLLDLLDLVGTLPEDGELAVLDSLDILEDGVEGTLGLHGLVKELGEQVGVARDEGDGELGGLEVAVVQLEEVLGGLVASEAGSPDDGEHGGNGNTTEHLYF
eukprot:236467_1